MRIVIHKVLTIKQPWAGLIILGIKKFETRSWKTTHRGILGIHSSNSKVDESGLKILDDLCKTMPETFYHGSTAMKICTTFGSIIGIAHLKDIYSTNHKHHSLSKLELDLGDYSENRFYWKLSSPQRFIDPIQTRGQLGLWSFTNL